MTAFPPLLDLPLPGYARSDLARQETVLPSRVIVNASVTYIVSSDAICYPLSADFTLTTSGLAANRNLVLVAYTGDGQPIARVPAPSPQAAATSNAYSFSAALATAYGVIASQQMIPMLPVLLFPGYYLQFAVLGVQTGDICSALAITCVMIPTGPAREPNTSLTPIPNAILEAA